MIAEKVVDRVSGAMSEGEREAAAREHAIDWRVERAAVARLATGVAIGRPWRVSTAGQECILRMIRDGFCADVIVINFNKVARKNREPFITPSHVFALAERGIPFPRVAEVHRCPTCNAKIVTNFCIACRVKEGR